MSILKIGTISNSDRKCENTFVFPSKSYTIKQPKTSFSVATTPIKISRNEYNLPKKHKTIM